MEETIRHMKWNHSKVNVIANTLSRKSLFNLRALNTRLTLARDGSIMAELHVRPTFIQQISELQKNDPKFKLRHELVKNGQTKEFSIGDYSNLYFKGRLCILNDIVLKQDILSEAHSSIYYIHPGNTRMYNDLKQMYWWSDDQFEQVIQILKDMLRYSVIEFEGSWEKFL
ncbi:integrase [Gossypium australe]|uniref:Integrase n=1 Tax=Gossypium australe TaxID=47621 RepID=A0A5B6WR41_9ROSI|nr:integrase [Gossypium australe]